MFFIDVIVRVIAINFDLDGNNPNNGIHNIQDVLICKLCTIDITTTTTTKHQ
jgi:hypothetical protein